LKTNFTQFGEGKLFGRTDWDRSYFVRYAKLYRPSAIMCWSPRARRFCRENPDLIKVVEDDGTLLMGRVVGFEGAFIEGQGRVEASAGRIRVSDLSPGVDGSVLLGYHFVPYLKASPPVALEPEFREDDPVPFIRLRPSAGTQSVELEVQLPGGR
jgi:DNA-binding transcriptional LysR family regulator